MKNIIALFCILSIFSSCKQTQLTTNFKRSPKKVYVKPEFNTHYTNFVSIKNKTTDFKKSKPANKIENRSFGSKETINNDELYADVEVSEQDIIKNDKKAHQKLINIDSVLINKLPSLEDKDEIIKLSKRAKKFSIISLISATLSIVSYLIAFPSTYDFLHVFGAIFGISSLILSIIAFIHLIKAIKKIKKKGEKIKGQEKTIKNNIKTAFWISLLLLLAPIIGGIIFLLTFSISIGSIGPFYF